MPREFGQQRAVVPEGASQEVLQGATFLVEQVGDGLAVLAVDAREQPAQVGASVFGLLGASQASDEGLGERPQPLKEASEDFRGNLALRQ